MLQFYGLCFCYFYIHDKSRLNLRRVVCVGSVGFCKRDAERACVRACCLALVIMCVRERCHFIGIYGICLHPDMLFASLLAPTQLNAWNSFGSICCSHLLSMIHYRLHCCFSSMLWFQCKSSCIIFDSSYRIWYFSSSAAILQDENFLDYFGILYKLLLLTYIVKG